MITIDPRVARGADLRVVVEAKDRPMSMRAIREELREARENRGAAVGLVVFSAAHAPSRIAPFAIVGTDVYCVVDPLAPDPPRSRRRSGWRDSWPWPRSTSTRSRSTRLPSARL